MIIKPNKFSKNIKLTISDLEKELKSFNKDKDIALFSLVDALKNQKDVQENILQDAHISLLKFKLDNFLSKNNKNPAKNLTILIDQVSQQFIDEHLAKLSESLDLNKLLKSNKKHTKVR